MTISEGQYQLEWGLCNEIEDDFDFDSDSYKDQFDVGTGNWTVASGKVIKINEMTIAHLRNAIAWADRMGVGGYEKIEELRAELACRDGVKLSVEKQETLLVEIDKAVETSNRALEMVESEDVQVLSLQLNDATEDMNDAIRRLEMKFAKLKVPPERIFLEPERDRSRSVWWDGEIFHLEIGASESHPLLSSSRKNRTDACAVIPRFRINK